MSDPKAEGQPEIPSGLVERYKTPLVVKGGYWRDEFFHRGGDGKDIFDPEKSDKDWNKNVITVGMTFLLAGLMKNEPTFNGKGILQHAQGIGQPSWDVTLPTPLFSQTQLVSEYFRKSPDSISYTDPSGNPVLGITNSILVRTTLDFGDANGNDNLGRFIREQGIFGGNATATLNSGYMADAINHKARFKDHTVKIIRFIRFVF